MITLVQSTKRYHQRHNVIAKMMDPLLCGFEIEFPADYAEFIEEYGECKIEDFIHIFPHSRVYIKTKRLRENEAFVEFMLSFNAELDKEDFIKNVIFIGEAQSDLIMYYNNSYYLFFYEVDEIWRKCNNLDEVFANYEKGEYWEKMELKTFTPINDTIPNDD